MKKYLCWSFYALFGLCFTLLLINVVFHNTTYPSPAVFLLPAIVLALLLLSFAYSKLKKHEAVLQKNYRIILPVFLGIMLLLQLVFGFRLQFQPAFDMGAIYDGASEWVKTGTFASQYDYMYYFPNNLGSMAYLKFFFSIASLFGIQNFFGVGIVVNSLMSVGTMAAVSCICKKLSGYRNAVFALLLFALSLPFYFIGAAFYTDALSMLFPVLVYYLYLLARDTSSRKQQILYGVLLGIAGAVGMLVKFTVIIMLIAVAIEVLLRKGLKNMLPWVFSALPVLILVPLVFNAYIYSAHLDKAQAEKQNTPYSHWIMMGLSGEGAYDPQDYNFTRSFSDTKQRDEEIRKEIGQRVKKLGLSGLSDLYTKKSVRCFGDGTFALSDFLDDSPKNETALHDYILYDGNHYKGYRTICSGVFFAILILTAFAAYQKLFTKQTDWTSQLAAPAAAFGIFLFLLLWETNGRYALNFVPVLFICASLGIDFFTNTMAKAGAAVRSAF